jgi:hypothetical protein
MPSYLRRKPSYSFRPAARRVPVSRSVARPGAASPAPTPFAASPLALPFASSRADPYLDYGRFLTPEGGMLFRYKDLDLRFRYLLWRILAWTAATGLDAWFLRSHSPIRSALINVTCLLVFAAINWLIIRKPPEIYRLVEIRPDCMILEGAEVFWLHMMENGLPTFRPDEEGNQVLCGIYGTRFVEYLTARRFDEFDRMPEVFVAHLQDAMRQLWSTALTLGTVQVGSPPPRGFQR